MSDDLLKLCDRLIGAAYITPADAYRVARAYKELVSRTSVDTTSDVVQFIRRKARKYHQMSKKNPRKRAQYISSRNALRGCAKAIQQKYSEI